MSATSPWRRRGSPGSQVKLAKAGRRRHRNRQEISTSAENRKAEEFLSLIRAVLTTRKPPWLTHWLSRVYGDFRLFSVKPTHQPTHHFIGFKIFLASINSWPVVPPASFPGSLGFGKIVINFFKSETPACEATHQPVPPVNIRLCERPISPKCPQNPLFFLKTPQ
jgi:hypothetical protein